MKTLNIPPEVKKKFSSIFGSKPALIIYSIILGASLWILISLKKYPNTVKTIRNIPVTVKLPDSSADSESEFQLQEQSVNTVDIKIEANRSVIGNLTASDFEATVDASSMSEPGTQVFTINIKCLQKIEYVVDSISEETNSVTIDKTESKDINVVVDAPGIQVAEGCILDSETGTCTPDTITITGPSQLLHKIDHASVYVEAKKDIDTSYTTYSNLLKYYDENGAEVESDNLKPSVTEFIVSFNVLNKKDLDLTYQIKNQPSDFDEEWFRSKISLSPDKIQIAANGSSLDDLKTWDFGTISLNDVGLDFSKSLSVDIPSEYRNISDINSVTLTLDNSDLAEKEITIDDIKVTNQPVGYTDFKVNTDSLTVTLIGDKDQIDKITKADIIANINLVGYKVQSYDFTYDVSISFSKFNKVWAVGSYKANVSCKQESDTENN